MPVAVITKSSENFTYTLFLNLSQVVKTWHPVGPLFMSPSDVANDIFICGKDSPCEIWPRLSIFFFLFFNFTRTHRGISGSSITDLASSR